MSDIEAAREALEEILTADGWTCDCMPDVRACPHRVECEQGVLHYVDAYALAIHVKACRERSNPLGEFWPNATHECGDNWYCSDAPGQSDE